MKTPFVILVLTFSLQMFGESQQSAKATTVFQSFVMTVAEDGKNQADWFEIWELSGEFGGERPSCSIRVASFTVRDETFVHLWSHTAQRITEVRPGVFRLDMSGRLNPPFGLEVMVQLNRERTRVIEMSASTRTGTRGQSVITFRIDRNSENRKVPPLRNPSWLLQDK